VNTLIAIDPGVRNAGCAVFVGGQLAEAVLFAPLDGADHFKGEAVARLFRWYLEPRAHLRLEAAICELPQVYSTAQQKGRQSDLIDLAVVCGAIGQVASDHGLPTRFINPRVWKGQTPKDITTARAQVELTPDERVRVKLPKQGSLHHNVWDAIGIGLWGVGRWT